MERLVKIVTLSKGHELEVTSGGGYMLLGNDECVSFYFDTNQRAYVEASSSTQDDCPSVFLAGTYEDAPYLEVCFPEYKGWRYHSSSGGKSIGICLVNRCKEQ